VRTPSEAHDGVGVRIFAGLGRAVTRHPWYPIIFWAILLVVTLPFLARVGFVTTNSATNLPSDAPSAIAAAKIGSLFPNGSAGSDSILLLTGHNILGPTGQNSVLGLDRALVSDRNLTEVAGVDSLYTSYATYLAGQAALAVEVVGQGLHSTPSPLQTINNSAHLLWSPPAMYLQNWRAFGANHSALPPAQWNYPAFNSTRAQLLGNSSLQSVLNAFYSGWDGSNAGFNGSANCAGAPASVLNCTDQAARANLQRLVPMLFSGAAARLMAQVILTGLGVENFTGWASVRSTAAGFLALESGSSPAFLLLVWATFPTLSPTPFALVAWATGVATTESASVYPQPIPTDLERRFVSPDGAAEIVLVSYSVGSGYTNPNGANPVYLDVAEISRLAPRVLATTDPAHALSFYQTGGGPLDSEESSVLASSLAIVLPLTVIVLVVITMLYFRAPLTPLITFGGLGIALGLGIGGVVLIGTLVTHVDVTSIELEQTFVLGVGTDYSIFLVARFREELHLGAAPRDAVVTSVTWAGQSIATSGATAVIATLALAFSGVALLSQWGMVLSLAILLTVLISLTLVPAFLTLLGPRVFWPYSGDRLSRQSARVREALQGERTYFFRAGRFTQRRPKVVLALIIALSVPLVYIALTAPISYDFYGQLPGGEPASNGLTQLGHHFGGGYAFPIQALVTFHSPLLAGNQTNGSEFSDLALLTAQFANTSGVLSVASPVGASGAPLGLWLGYSSLPFVPQQNLRGLLSSFVGTDGRSVLLTLLPSASGLSYEAVRLLASLETVSQGFLSQHPEAGAVYFGGGAPITHDLQQQTALATERMLVIVSIGLILVLFAVLRSWIIPLLAVATIGLSLAWAWGVTNVVLEQLLGVPLFFYVPTILFIIILGLGIDYNIFLLTRVREERLRGRSAPEAAVQAVARTGGIISAAAVILASAFAVLSVGQFLLLRAIGFSVATAVLLDAMVVRTYLVPSALHALGERVWKLYPFQRVPPPSEGTVGPRAGSPP
jgi:uncharacterized membrane protein YdfJ with MMPL/SSD domain